MRKRNLIAVAVVAIAAVVLAGGLFASNMGFKLNFALNGLTSSKSGTNYVSLPYNPQVGVSLASDWFKDILASGGDVSGIQKHTRTTDLFQSYGFGSTTDFTLLAGESYIVKMNGDLNYIIVGSHDPSASVTLQGINVGGSKSGTNYYSHPYHAVSASAKDLFLEIGAQVQRHNRTTDLFQSYDFGATDFPLNPGDGYIFKVPLGETIVKTPAHY